jgi:RNA polymerase sigma-70 factor (ECF subfamily)
MRPGDEFDTFYLTARGRLVGQLFALTGDLHDAEDLVQEAFAQAAAHWSRIGSYEAPEAWVRRVAFNLAANRLRRLRRQARALLRLSRPEIVPPLDAGEVDLVRALRALPARQREVVVLHHLADLPVQTVAAQLGVPDSTVKSLLWRARATLARLLSDADIDPLREVRAAHD